MSVSPNGPGFSENPQQSGMPSMPPMPPAAPLPASPAATDIQGVRPVRPGSLTAAAVLGFVTSGFEILGGLLWIIGGSVVGDVEDAFGTGTDAGSIIMIFGLMSLLVGGVYIWGGIMALKLKTLVLYIAAGAGVVLNVTMMVLSESRSGLLSFILGVVTLLLLALPASRKF